MVLSECLNPFKQAVRTVRCFSTDNVVSFKGKQLQIPQIPLHEFVWKDLEKWSDKTAAICFETQRSYTYHQLYKKSLSLTRFFKDSLKLQKQDTVGVVLPNIPEYPIVVLGAVQAGLRVTTCNPNYTSDEIKRQLEVSRSKVVFTSRELLPRVRQATDVPVVEVSGDKGFTSGAISFEEISSGQGCQPVPDISVNDIVFLPYSSGTTGLPKGVQLSHSNLVSNLCQATSPEFTIISNYDGLGQDIVPAFLPFFHIYGLVIVLLKALVQGAQIITMPEFNSDNFAKLLKNFKPDVLYSVPLVVIMTVNNPNIKSEDLEKIRILSCGAAPLRATDVERFHAKTRNKITLVQTYGMTEASPAVLFQTPRLKHGVKIGGSGFLLPNTIAKVIPSDGSSCRALGPNQSGELIISGPQIMVGYSNDPQANKDIFVEENWIRSGDIGHYDEHGHFFITDRLKELIKVKGFQVPPAELEAVLREHPSVDDVGVVGVPHPVLGEAPKAFVVVKPGEVVKEAQLEEFVGTKVAKYKRLAGGVVFVDAIPKNPSGKILRRELKKL